MNKLKTFHVALIAVLIAVAAIAGGTYINDRVSHNKQEAKDMQHNQTPHAHTRLDFLGNTTYQPNKSGTLEFAITDKDGNRLKESAFSVEHEKRMHVIVASKDLTEFQHVHPRFDSPRNAFKVDTFVFPRDGNYRIFADYVKGEREPIVYQDVTVGNASAHQDPGIGEPNLTAMADGNQIDLSVLVSKSSAEKTLEFSLTRAGKPVTDLESYLGALGHLVVLRDGDLEYIHTHALTTDLQNQTGKVQFAVDFKKAGTYKAFVQFQRGGKVMTASYVINITEEVPSNNATPSQSEEHSGH